MEKEGKSTSEVVQNENVNIPESNSKKLEDEKNLEDKNKLMLSPKTIANENIIKQAYFISHNSKILQEKSCLECEIMYDKDPLKRHITHHHGINSKVSKSGKERIKYNCIDPDCDLKNVSQSLYVKHMKEVHNNYKPFQCESCDSKFTTFPHLKIHRNQHLGDDKATFICDTCGTTFKTQKYLKSHILYRHSKERLHKCDICDKAFLEKNKLKFHKLNEHSGGKAFSCSFCGQGLRTKSALDYHVASHKNEKVFQCSICLKSYRSASDLKRHIKVHRNSKSITCTVCNNSFARKDYCKKHLKLVHDIDVQPFGDLNWFNKYFTIKSTECDSSPVCPTDTDAQLSDKSSDKKIKSVKALKLEINSCADKLEKTMNDKSHARDSILLNVQTLKHLGPTSLILDSCDKNSVHVFSDDIMISEVEVETCDLNSNTSEEQTIQHKKGNKTENAANKFSVSQVASNYKLSDTKVYSSFNLSQERNKLESSSEQIMPKKIKHSLERPASNSYQQNCAQSKERYENLENNQTTRSFQIHNLGQSSNYICSDSIEVGNNVNITQARGINICNTNESFSAEGNIKFNDRQQDESYASTLMLCNDSSSLVYEMKDPAYEDVQKIPINVIDKLESVMECTESGGGGACISGLLEHSLGQSANLVSRPVNHH